MLKFSAFLVVIDLFVSSNSIAHSPDQENLRYEFNSVQVKSFTNMGKDLYVGHLWVCTDSQGISPNRFRFEVHPTLGLSTFILGKYPFVIAQLIDGHTIWMSEMTGMSSPNNESYEFQVQYFFRRLPRARGIVEETWTQSDLVRIFGSAEGYSRSVVDKNRLVRQFLSCQIQN